MGHVGGLSLTPVVSIQSLEGVLVDFSKVVQFIKMVVDEKVTPEGAFGQEPCDEETDNLRRMRRRLRISRCDDSIN